MPELPEVETVRSGLAANVLGATISDVKVFENRSIRQHDKGKKDFQSQLVGNKIVSANRRGKFMWLQLQNENRDDALVIHLGMSGQVLLHKTSELEKHARVVFDLQGKRNKQLTMRFVDQRMFGGMFLDSLIQTPEGDLLPSRVTHIARDLFDPFVDDDEIVAEILKRKAGIKSLLLNQSIVSGVGNIYADEALWQTKLHYLTPGSRLKASQVSQTLSALREIMQKAIAAGGTSFDEQYVRVNGESGWFEVELNAYGQEGEPCARCGRQIVREAWANRSSHRCPRCQPARNLGG
jgi:formamidopyrimidine-DNA glycosylase